MIEDKVSIITRCMNRAHHLELSLDYMILQNWRPLEIIVVNYDSTDGLHEMLWDKYEWYMGIGLIKEIYVPNCPKFVPAHAQNVGIRHATGEWLFFMDADNVPKPHFIPHLMSRVRGQKMIFARPIPDYMHTDMAGQMLCRKEDIANIGGFLEDLRHGWGYEDGDIRDRLILYGCDLLEYNTTMVEMIKHGEEDRTGYMENRDRNITQQLNQDTARRNKMWHGFSANIGTEWGAGGTLVTNKEDTRHGFRHLAATGREDGTAL